MDQLLGQENTFGSYMAPLSLTHVPRDPHAQTPSPEVGAERQELLLGITVPRTYTTVDTVSSVNQAGQELRPRRFRASSVGSGGPCPHCLHHSLAWGQLLPALQTALHLLCSKQTGSEQTHLSAWLWLEWKSPLT